MKVIILVNRISSNLAPWLNLNNWRHLYISAAYARLFVRKRFVKKQHSAAQNVKKVQYQISEA